MLLAAAGVIISWFGRPGGTPTLLLLVLTAAGLLGPLEQARLHTLASLNKHVGLGAWFAAIAAADAIDRFLAAAPAGRAQALTTGPERSRWSSRSGLAPASPGSSPRTGPTRPASSRSSAHSPITATATCWSRPPLSPGTTCPPAASGNAGPPPATSSCPQARTPAARPARQESLALGNAGVFAEFITHGYFSYVALNYADTTALDHQITEDLRHNAHYRIIAVVPDGTEIPAIRGTYIIWRYTR